MNQLIISSNQTLETLAFLLSLSHTEISTETTEGDSKLLKKMIAIKLRRDRVRMVKDKNGSEEAKYQDWGIVLKVK